MRKFALLFCFAFALAPAAADAAPVLLTNASNGTTVTVAPGQQVDVALTGSAGLGTEFLWTLPVVSNPGVLSLRSEGRLGVTTYATYIATHQGSTTITSSESCHILAPGHACPLFVLLWRAGVNVYL